MDEDQETPNSALLQLPSSTKKDIAAINCSLATSITHWMKKRGKAVRPKLSAEQKQQLKECFELMDQDGSGAIDAEELGAAFKLLGIRMKLSELSELLAEVDHDGSGEVEYLEFLEIMTTTLQRLAEEREAEDAAGGTPSEPQVPFALMATAYRRKRLMEGIISGDKEVMQQIMQLSERQAAEALAATSSGNRVATEAQMRKNAARTAEAEVRKMLNSITKRSVARLAALRVDQELLMRLTPEERRLLTQVAARAGICPEASSRGTLPQMATTTTTTTQQHSTGPIMSVKQPPWGSTLSSKPLDSGNLASTPLDQPLHRSQELLPPVVPAMPEGWQQHYSSTATHRQLLQVPHRLEVKFSKPTISLGAAGGSKSALAGCLPTPSATHS